MRQEERLRRAAATVREVRAFLERCAELGNPRKDEDRVWSEFIAHAISKALECEQQRRKRAGVSP